MFWQSAMVSVKLLHTRSSGWVVFYICYFSLLTCHCQANKTLKIDFSFKVKIILLFFSSLEILFVTGKCSLPHGYRIWWFGLTKCCLLNTVNMLDISQGQFVHLQSSKCLFRQLQWNILEMRNSQQSLVKARRCYEGLGLGTRCSRSFFTNSTVTHWWTYFTNFTK